MNRLRTPDATRRETFGGATLARPIAVTPDDEQEFQLAMDLYKRSSGRQFPTWSEILEVLRSIGYAKRIWRPVAGWSPVPLPPSIGMALESDDATRMVGWFARVETPLGPDRQRGGGRIRRDF